MFRLGTMLVGWSRRNIELSRERWVELPSALPGGDRFLLRISGRTLPNNITITRMADGEVASFAYRFIVIQVLLD
jgi:hypothetical protein